MTPAELCTLMDRMGWTRRYVASLCGVTGRTVSRWRNGVSEIPHTAAVVLRMEAAP